MATPKIIADFETQLATALAVGGTSFTLSSATDDDGVALPNGKYYFTIDNGTSQKEYVVGTLASTAVTAVSNVTRQGTESTGVDRAHRVGASVIMTDFLTYKNYIDETTVAGAADANTNTKGVVEGATLAEVRARTATGGTGAALVITPDVADDMPTEDEKAAMAGSGTAPSASNKFVTVGDIDDNTIFVPPTVLTYLNAASPATWTKDAGLKYITVEVQAIGGAGSAVTSSARGGGGGGGGGYSKKLITASSLGATETVTIGGAAVASSFGSHCSANPGVAGTANSNTPGAGGSATGGDVNIAGQSGQNGVDYSSPFGRGGQGGGSVLGVGGQEILGANGSSASGYGAGGGGSSNTGSGSPTGGSAAPAIVIVTEYYS